ncbi:30S ribosomal protein S5 [Roseibacillus persicicus]|uniref:30S ribosomal protein S5 n=1 Tax=Roseibacillus persicicus TaxID=454148 RepID=UPI00398A7402
MSEDNDKKPTDAPTPEPAASADTAPVKTEAAAEKPAAPRGDRRAPERRDDNRGGGNRGGGDRRGGGPGGRRDGGRGRRDEEEDDGMVEKVVFINRCAKVVKGGRRFSFSALVVAGDLNGKVGFGFGKANEVAECIKKASEIAKRSLEKMDLDGDSIPHETYAEFGGGKVLLRPASPGTGVIAGGGVRAVCEAVGIKDVLGKSLGSNNHANVVKATLKALSELRNRDEIYALRGKKKSKAI